MVPAEDVNGVTLGELGRRMDRMEGVITGQVAGVQRAVELLSPDLAVVRATQAEMARRVGELEAARASAEAHIRASLVAVLVAVVTSVGGILVAVVGVH